MNLNLAEEEYNIMNFKITFAGDFSQDIPIETIKEYLAQLFRTTADDIEEIFFKQEKIVIASDLDSDKADVYIQSLRNIGVYACKELDLDPDIFDEPLPKVERHHQHASEFTRAITKKNKVTERLNTRST